MANKTTSTALIKALRLEEARERKPCLLFVSGLHAGRLLALNLNGKGILIGRGEDTDVRLETPEISRHHARIEVDAEQRLYLVDLNSKNGTFVNDQPVERAEVRADDKLRIGPYLLLKLTFQDDEEIAFARQLYNRAVSDPLTGIVNRQFFRSTLEREWAFAGRHDQRIALALLDIDRFKPVNDTYGHLVGDEVLREFVRRLQQTTRIEDLLARFGGEEFIVLLRDIDLRGAVTVAERIREAVAARPFPAMGYSIPVTVSIGVACFEAEQIRAGRPEDLIREADQRLYAAKAAGRNVVVGEGASPPPD